jgi:hypothetical protein
MIKIGFFGDSYVDLDHAGRLWEQVWGTRLVKILAKHWQTEVSATNSGLGGTNLFYAISEFQQRIDNTGPEFCDYAVFTFTWIDRWHSIDPEKNKWHRAFQERRKDSIDFDFDEYELAHELHYKYFNEPAQKLFEYESMVKHILDLPEKYPKIKFIFLPNTEVARPIAKKYFKKGVLIDFAFETITNNERSSTAPMPCMDDRKGHMEKENHNRFARYITNIVLNYESYKDKILEFDYHLLDLRNYPIDV